jgi:hypothetical protein
MSLAVGREDARLWKHLRSLSRPPLDLPAGCPERWSGSVAEHENTLTLRQPSRITGNAKISH